MILSIAHVTQRFSIIFFSLSAINTVGVTASSGATLSNAVRLSAEQAAVRVFASGDRVTLRSRVGSGFLWRDTNTIVTALHLVVGATRIGVQQLCGGELEFRQATLTHVNIAADLAVITITTPTSCGQPIPTQAEHVPDGSALWIVGFPIDATEVRSVEVKSSDIAPATLRGVLNTEQQAQLNRLGLPSLNLSILQLEGGPLPGNSGSMVITQAGNLFGIANGGLQQGTIGIGWAIPSAELADLTDAGGVTVSLEAIDIKELFSTFTGAPAGRSNPALRSSTFLAVQNAMANYDVEPEIVVRSFLLLRTDIPFSGPEGQRIWHEGPKELVHSLVGMQPTKVTVEGYLLGEHLGGAVTDEDFRPATTKRSFGDAEVAVMVTGSGPKNRMLISLGFLIQALESRSTEKFLVDLSEGEVAWVELRAEFDPDLTSLDLEAVTTRLKQGYGYFWLPAVRKDRQAGRTPWPHVCMLFDPQPIRQEFNGSTVVVIRWTLDSWRGISDRGCAKQMEDVF